MWFPAWKVRTDYGALIFFFQAEDGIRDRDVTGVQTCALPISMIGAMGAIQISAIASQQYQGQAHAGIDKIPGSGDQTWNLKGGERIIQPKANMDLTNYLKSNQNRSGGDTTVTVQNHFAGSFIDEGGFAGMIMKDRKSTRLNSSHITISYAVFCLKKKKKKKR